MMVRTLIVFALLAAIIVPVLLAEARRFRPRAAPREHPAQRAPKAAPAKPPLRLVVSKNDMDRELAALLAKNSRKPTETDE